MFFLSDCCAEFGRGRGRDKMKRRPRRGEIITTKTYVNAGWGGLRMKKGAPLKTKSTGDSRQDAKNTAKAFYDREQKAGRMNRGIFG